MRIPARLLLAAATLLFAMSAAAAKVPGRVEIRYQVLFGSLSIGEGYDVFEHNGSSYKLTSESKTAGVAALIYGLNVTRVSTGTITARGLRPDSYDEIRNGKTKRRVRFDWKQKKAELFDGVNTQTVDLPENTWDMASFGYSFAFFPPTSAQMELFLTDGRRVSPYKFAVLEKERIDTELGAMDTVHVKKVQRPDDPARVRRVARAGSQLRTGADPLHREGRHRVRLGGDSDQRLGSLAGLRDHQAFSRSHCAQASRAVQLYALKG